MSEPVRIQLSRVKGWRMPPNTVKVDRSTRWGNPYKAYVDHELPELSVTPDLAVKHFELATRLGHWMARAHGHGTFYVTIDDVRRELAGKNLACWCKVGEPCHADVLLRIANE